jgi:AcrR family transcriptional regulator
MRLTSSSSEGATPRLREQLADHTREQILRALVDLLRSGGLDQLSMAAVAERAGLSVRTLYRYVGDRDQLNALAGQLIYEEVFHIRELPQNPEGVAERVSSAGRLLEENVELVRALARSSTDDSLRGARLRWRAAVKDAVAEVVEGLPEEERRSAVAMIQLLASSVSWLALREDGALDCEEASTTLGWAIRTLVADIEARSRAAGQPKRRSSATAVGRRTR